VRRASRTRWPWQWPWHDKLAFQGHDNPRFPWRPLTLSSNDVVSAWSDGTNSRPGPTRAVGPARCWWNTSQRRRIIYSSAANKRSSSAAIYWPLELGNCNRLDRRLYLRMISLLLIVNSSDLFARVPQSAWHLFQRLQKLKAYKHIPLHTKSKGLNI